MRWILSLPRWLQLVVFIGIAGVIFTTSGVLAVGLTIVVALLLDLGSEVMVLSDRLEHLEQSRPATDPDDIDWQAWDEQ